MALHMVSTSHWCGGGTPDAFVLRLFSSGVERVEDKELSVEG